MLFYSEKNKANYVVPIAFATDLASFQFIRGRSANAPAVLHDWLYQNGIKFKQIKTRLEADDIFYEAMIDTDVPPYRALLYYYMVRLFGACFFKGVV